MLIAHVLEVLEEEDGHAGDNPESQADEYEDCTLNIDFFYSWT